MQNWTKFEINSILIVGLNLKTHDAKKLPSIYKKPEKVERFPLKPKIFQIFFDDIGTGIFAPDFQKF